MYPQADHELRKVFAGNTFKRNVNTGRTVKDAHSHTLECVINSLIMEAVIPEGAKKVRIAPSIILRCAGVS